MARNRIVIDTAHRASFSRSVLNRFVRSFREEFETGKEAAARSGINKILAEWQAEARKLAPKKTGKLRDNTRRDVDAGLSGNQFGGDIVATAVNRKSGGSFDYATYLHDVYPKRYGERFKKPTTAGTIPRFIDVPLEKNRHKWEQALEDEFRREMQRRGF